jgi:hypothetical protein
MISAWVLNDDLDQLIRDRYPNFRTPAERVSPVL